MSDVRLVRYTDLIPSSGAVIRRQPKTVLKWVLRKAREGIEYVEHAEGHGDEMMTTSRSRRHANPIAATKKLGICPAALW